jgi:hypothetical protein
MRDCAAAMMGLIDEILWKSREVDLTDRHRTRVVVSGPR